MFSIVFICSFSVAISEDIVDNSVLFDFSKSDVRVEKFVNDLYNYKVDRNLDSLAEYIGAEGYLCEKIRFSGEYPFQIACRFMKKNKVLVQNDFWNLFSLRIISIGNAQFGIGSEEGGPLNVRVKTFLDAP